MTGEITGSLNQEAVKFIGQGFKRLPCRNTAWLRDMILINPQNKSGEKNRFSYICVIGYIIKNINQGR